MMTYYRSLLIFIVYLIQECTTSVPVPIYIPKGDTVKLFCPFKSISFPPQWRGPPDLTVLSTKDKIRSKLQNLERLEIFGNHDNGEYNLRVKQITTYDEGHYRCISNLNNTAVQSDFYVYLVVGPSNMRILNTTDEGVVNATEGHMLQLNCRVESGIPEEMLTWKTGNTILKVGGPMSISYNFIPTREDNLRNYTCSASNIIEIRPIEQTIQISVSYQPKVIISGEDQIEVLDGKSLTLVCTSDYDLGLVKWVHYGMTEDHNIQTMAQNESSLSITSIDRSFSGRYECQVFNKGQVGSDSVLVKVKYKPFVDLINTSLYLRTEIRIPVNVSIQVESFEMPSILWVHSAGGKLSTWVTSRLHVNRTDDKFLLSSSITPLVHNHFGNYSCRIRNTEGSRDIEIHLLYKEPHIESFPKVRVYSTYETIHLRCSINPKLYERWSFSWKHFRSGTLIRTFDQPVVDNVASLNLSFVDYADAGVYVCALHTDDANFTSQSLVFVEGPPIMAGKNISAVKTDSGNIVFLSIQVYCYPNNISVTWFYEERQKSTNAIVVSNTIINVTSVSIRTYGVPVTVSGYKIIVSINKINESEGKIVCQIKNGHGIKEESFELRDILTLLDSINIDAQNTGKSSTIYIYGSAIAPAVLVLTISIICISRWLHRRRESGLISSTNTSSVNPVINIQSDTAEMDEIENLYHEIADEDVLDKEETNQQTALYLICTPDHELTKDEDDEILVEMKEYETCNTDTEYLSQSSKPVHDVISHRRTYLELQSVSESDLEAGTATKHV